LAGLDSGVVFYRWDGDVGVDAVGVAVGAGASLAAESDVSDAAAATVASFDEFAVDDEAAVADVTQSQVPAY
jgi:hypothetical protein